MHFRQNDLSDRVQKLHQSPWKAVIACTGAGSGIQDILWQEPGASSTILEAGMQYHRCALADLIGREPESYCSEDTALWMASAAFRRANELALRDGDRAAKLIGLGVTAAVATGKPKKGDHRVHIAARTADGLHVVNVTFEKGRLDRRGEGALCDLLALDTILSCAGLPTAGIDGEGAHLRSEEVRPLDGAPGQYWVAPRRVPPLAAAHDGRDDLFALGLCLPEGKRIAADAIDPATHVLYPGSFAPLHYGHELMAMQTERMTGKKVVFAITATHPEKGVLSVEELLRRAEQFRWRWPVLFTERDSLYVEKARRFPGVPILVGADAALGILDPKYYGGIDGRDAVLREMTDLRSRFYVVGRQIGDRFVTLEDIPIPSGFEKLFLPVSGRWDIRSRDLR